MTDQDVQIAEPAEGLEPSDLAKDLSAAFDAAKEIEPVEPKPEEKAAPEQAESAESSEIPAASAEEPKESAVEPPQHWSSTDKEKFSSIPAEHKAWVMDRYKDMEADYTRKMQEVAPFRHTKEQIDQILAPHRQGYQLQGLDDVAAIRQLVSAHEFLQRDPKTAIQALAKSYGLDTTIEQPYVDPEVAVMKQELAQLRNFIGGQLQASQAANTQSAQAEIDAFSQAKEGNNVLHPYFDDVRQDMAVFIQSGVAKTLQDAYDRAVYANPSTRTRLLDGAKQAEAKKAEAERIAKAEKARKAGFDVKGTGAATKPQAPTLRDELSAAWDASTH